MMTLERAVATKDEQMPEDDADEDPSEHKDEKSARDNERGCLDGAECAILKRMIVHLEMR